MINAILAVLAVIQVYRLERDTETEHLQLVGADGVRRACCIIDPDEYAILTGRVDQVWKSLNETGDGRKKLHGPIVSQEIDETNGTKTEYYRDGYQRTFKLEVRTNATPRVSAPSRPRPSFVPIKTRNTNISERQQKMRESIQAWKEKAKNPTEVTVEHDAATGKDLVK